MIHDRFELIQKSEVGEIIAYFPANGAVVNPINTADAHFKIRWNGEEAIISKPMFDSLFKVIQPVVGTPKVDKVLEQIVADAKSIQKSVKKRGAK